MNNRRKLIVALGAGALTVPFGAFAQQPVKVWRVGYLGNVDTRAPSRPDPLNPFLQGMQRFGYVEGKNLVIERRFPEGNNERLPALATDLVKLKVDVIIASATPSVSALQKATTTIPIVMWNIGDPVGAGLVKSLARPGGNITGLSSLETGRKHSACGSANCSGP
jgi:putative ABC transport system substrate-binding protein